MIDLTQQTLLYHMIREYTNPRCQSLSEFKGDLMSIKWVVAQITAYDKTGEVNEKLLLNHIITIYNLWGSFATDLLFFKVKKERWHILKTFLVFLDRMPESVRYQKKEHLSSDIQIDANLVSLLRNL
jgi:hypothetical protein